MDAVRGADLTQRHKAGLCWPGSLHHQNLGFLCRSLRGSPQDCKRLAYIALVWSGLEDASIIWHPTLKTDAEALEHIQRKSTRWVTSMYETWASVSKLLKDLQWETLETRHRQQRLVFLYKILKEQVVVPAINRHNLLHPCQLRLPNKQKLYRPGTQTTEYQNYFVHRTIPQWNALPESVAQTDTVSAFKCRLAALP